MPRWTLDELNAYETRRARLRPVQPERPARVPLERPKPRKTPGGAGVARHDHGTLRITFRCFAVRPLDWDNYRFKSLQDALVEVGLLPCDDYHTLQGQVISCKAHSKAEERTEITIERIQ